MGEAQDRWDQIKGRTGEMTERAQGAEQRAADMTKAMYDLANDMTYPVDDQGNTINIHWLIPMLSFHLARCGYKKDEESAVIKQVPHPYRGQPGFAEDAVLYPPVDATGHVPQAFIQPPEDEPGHPVNDEWRVRTHITVDGDTIKGGR